MCREFRDARAQVLLAGVGDLEADGGVTAGEGEEVAATVEEMRVGAATTGGDQGILSGGDAADEAQGEVGAHDTAEDGSGGVLGGGDQMDAGLTAALGEAGEGLGDGRAAGHQQVGKLIDEDDDARGTDAGELAAAVADLEGAQERMQGLDGLEGGGDERAGEVRGSGEGEEGAGLGIDTEQAQGVGRVGQDERSGDGAQEHGLTGAGGAGNEHVGDIGSGETGKQGHAGVGEAEERGGGGDVVDLGEEREEVDRLGLRVGEGEHDTVGIAVDGEGGDAHGEGQVVGKALDGGEAGVGSGIEEEADEARADGAAGDTTGGTMGGEDGLDAIGLILEIGSDLL